MGEILGILAGVWFLGLFAASACYVVKSLRRRPTVNRLR